MKPWTKMGIGIGIICAVLIVLGVLLRSGARNFFYPAAPAMPAIVNEPMPEILAKLESVLTTKAPHVLAALRPGISAEEISKLENQYCVQLPGDVTAIYRWHNGSIHTTNFLSEEFIPGNRFMSLDEALSESAASSPDKAALLQRLAYAFFAGHRKSWICLFSDGAGDGYWFDPKRKPAEGAVFFNFNETGTYEFFPSAKNLMAGIVKCYDQEIFRVKAGSSPPELDEDFQRSGKIWDEFGASN